MFQTLRDEMSLYRRLIAMQIRGQMQYKVALTIEVLSYGILIGIEFIALILYFGPFPTLLGWHVGEVVLLSAVTSIGFGLAELFGSGIDNFDVIIRQGDFDRLLLRPATALMQVSTTQFSLRRLGRISVGLVSFVFSLFLLRTLDLFWTPLKILSLVLGVGSSAFIFVAILLLGATLCFWTIETTELTNILTYGGREMLSYPLTIYHQVLQRIFIFIVPLAFGTYIPICYTLGRSLPFGLPGQLAFISPLVALLFALVALFFWRVGVHHYQSSGN